MSRVIIATAGMLIVVGAGTAFWWQSRSASARSAPSPEPLAMAQPDKFAQDRDPLAGAKPVPFDPERAMKYLKQICEIGPRVSATDGMKKQQDLMIKHFEGLGATVTKQEFQAKQRSKKDKVPMTNLIVSWFPEKTRRVLLCSHYDTRPIADQELNRANWNRPFVSANDGASGVAMIMELAHHMKDLKTSVGVDFIFFDGEEYIFNNDPMFGDDYFLGSEHFAKEYTAGKATRKFTYVAGILYDLFAHENAILRVEQNSWESAATLVQQVWKIAEATKARSFKYERGEPVRDDHLALNAARIPTIDVIDFGYSHWHKLSDTVDKVSPTQMKEVADVTSLWLQIVK